MQSPTKEWQVALQRAKAINPLRQSPHSGNDFDLDALLDAENRRRLELVRSTAAHREREDDALLQRMHAATVRLDMVLEGSTSPAVALKKAQASYIKRWKEQSADFSEVLAAWNVARATAANVTTDFTSVSFTSNSSNVMSGRSPGRHGATATNSPKSGSKIDGVLQRLSQDESNISAVAAIATPAHARSTALRADASPKHVDHVNPNTSDSAWSHNTSSSAASAALASSQSDKGHSKHVRSPTSEIKSAKKLIKEQPDAIYNCMKRLCKRIESDISTGSPLPAYDEQILLKDSARLNSVVLQSLTKGAKLDEFTLAEAAAGFVYVLFAIVEDALLPAAWVHKHLSSAVHDDALVVQAVALLPQGQHRLLVAVKKHLRHLAQHVPRRELEALVSNRLSPCLLRSHEDVKACSLVTDLLLRHSSSTEGPDTSVVDAEPAPSSSRTPTAAQLHASVKPTMHTSSPVAAAVFVSVPSTSAAGDGEQGGPPSRLPPPLPKPAPAANLPLASAGKLLIAPNKSRSRSGSMEGNAGYASFKKELKDGLPSSLPEFDDD